MGFRLSNFLGDPFAIATISFGVISWIVAIAGAGASKQTDFPRLTWWGLVYEVVLIIFVFILYLNNTIELYKFTLVGLISVAFLYTTNSVNSLIYNGDSGYSCCAAGCILLSILNIIWILYFGGHPESPTNQFIDSFSLKNHSHNHGHLNNVNGNQVNHIPNDDYDDDDYKRYVSPVNLPEDPQKPSPHFQDNNLRQSQLTTNNKSNNTPYMSSSQLNGLENFSSSDVRDLTNNQSNNEVGNQFRYKAKALYSYDANPDDINEISFVKDEILDVEDIEGKWWQARRSNGQVGICPSNYVKLIE